MTDSTGRMTIAAPYGTWTVQVDTKTPLTSWPTITLSPLNAQPRPELNVDVLT